MNFVTISTPSSNQFDKNINFLENSQKQSHGGFASLAKNGLKGLKWGHSLENSIFINNRLEIENPLLELNSAIDMFKKKPRLVRSAIMVGTKKADSRWFSDNILGTGEFAFAATSPILQEQILTPKTKPIYHHVGISGIILLPWYLNYISSSEYSSQSRVLEITVYESHPEVVAALLMICDFQQLLTALETIGVSFNFIFESNEILLQESIFNHYAYQHPFALHGLAYIAVPSRSLSYKRLERWLFSEVEFGQRFIGRLGYTTDEANQVFLGATTIKYKKTMSFLTKDAMSDASLPVVIVASGPSLDKSIKLIQSYKSNCIVVAAGSSIATLLKHNVLPDFYVALERSLDDFTILSELNRSYPRLKEIKLITSTATDPRVTDLFAETYYYHRPLSSASSLFNIGQSTTLAICGPECINTAVELMLYIGFKTLILLGCDLGSADREYQRSKYAYGETPRVLDIPVIGNRQKTVYSQASLLLSRQALEIIFSRYPLAKIYRVGEGVKITASNLIDSDVLTESILSSSSDDSFIANLSISQLSSSYNIDRGYALSIMSKLIDSLDDLGSHLSSQMLNSSCWNKELELSLASCFDGNRPAKNSYGAKSMLSSIVVQYIFIITAPLYLSGLEDWNRASSLWLKSFEDYLKKIRGFLSVTVEIMNDETTIDHDIECFSQRMRRLLSEQEN